MNFLKDVQIFTLPNISDAQGYLVPFESSSVFKINIQRIFFVSSYKGAFRGKHAHKSLTQVVICVSGKCNVICDDGHETKDFLLNKSSMALKIPPGIWAEQLSLEDNTVLAVMCDYPFDEDDYIRDYKEFLMYRKNGRQD